MPMTVEDFSFLKDGSTDEKTSPKNRGTGSGAGNLRFMGQLRQYGSEATLTAKQVEYSKLISALKIKQPEQAQSGSLQRQNSEQVK